MPDRGHYTIERDAAGVPVLMSWSPGQAPSMRSCPHPRSRWTDAGSEFRAVCLRCHAVIDTHQKLGTALVPGT